MTMSPFTSPFDSTVLYDLPDVTAEQADAARATVARYALGDADRAELLAMLGLTS